MAKNKRTPKGRIDDARKSATCTAADADWEVEEIAAVAIGKDGNRYLGRATKGLRREARHLRAREEPGRCDEAAGRFP